MISRSTRRAAPAIVTVAASLLLWACSGSATGTPSPTGAPSAAGGGASAPATAACDKSTDAGTVQATIKDFAFSPIPVKAKVGDVVAWSNGDTAAHSVVLDDGACGTDSIASGSTAALVFSAAGTYAFHCGIHPTMKGTVEVQ
jgi:plastocyanin